MASWSRGSSLCISGWQTRTWLLESLTDPPVVYNNRTVQDYLFWDNINALDWDRNDTLALEGEPQPGGV
jgi:hypothetical protein